MANSKDKQWSRRAQAFWQQRQRKAGPGALTGYLLDESPASIGMQRFKGEWAQALGFLVASGVARKRCLDVGCGTGAWLQAFAHEFKTVEGWDYAPAMVAASRRNLAAAGLRNATLHVGQVTRRRGRAVFDMIFVGGVLMYTPPSELGVLLKSLARLLKPGGLLLLRESTTAGDTWMRQGDPLRAGMLAGGGHSDLDYVAVYRSREALEAALAGAGLQVQAVRPNLHYKISDLTEDWLRRWDRLLGGRMRQDAQAAERSARWIHRLRWLLHRPEIFVRHGLGLKPWKLENHWFLVRKN
jgi:SAM-dependent methyltransferase